MNCLTRPSKPFLTACVTTAACFCLALFSATNRALAQGSPLPSNPFVVFEAGIYEPVVHGPDLSLATVNLSDGTYAKTRIFRVSGLPGTTAEAIGNLYVNFDVTLCAYQLPGGAMAAVFTEFAFDNVVIDGQLFQVGTAELVIAEATGIYSPFAGGSIHMEFMTHVIDEFTLDEHCFCTIKH